MAFDPERFVHDELGALSNFIERVAGRTSDVLRSEAAELLELSAKIAAARLAGQDTSVAENALRASVANLKAFASMEVAYSILGYLEGLLTRSAGAAGAILFPVT